MLLVIRIKNYKIKQNKYIIKIYQNLTYFSYNSFISLTQVIENTLQVKIENREITLELKKSNSTLHCFKSF